MKPFSFSLSAALAAVLFQSTAPAHIGYGGRDFGTLVTGAPAASIAISNLSGGFGWADATDADYGDSHRGRFFRFTLTETTSVSITAQANDLGAIDNLLPAFSLYSGLGHLAPEQGSHDSATLSVESRPVGAEGSIRALGDWSIGNDPTTVVDPDTFEVSVLYPASLRTFTFIGYAVDGTAANFGNTPGIIGDGAADGFVTGIFHDLAPGDYTIFVGGADYALQSTETSPTYPTYGVTVSIQAIPEPASIALATGLGALVLCSTRRRRQ